MFSRGLIVSLALVFAIAGCGKKDGASGQKFEGKYADVMAYLTEASAADETLASELKAAKNGKDAAQAITKYNAVLKKHMATDKEMDKRFPELLDKKNTPQELKPFMERSSLAQKASVSALDEAQIKFITDEEVKKASLEMMAIIKGE